MLSSRANIYEITSRDERAKIQAENIRLIQDSWFKLLLQFDPKTKRQAHEPVTNLEVDIDGDDPQSSLELEIGKYDPSGNLSSELASLSLRCQYKDKQKRLQFPALSNLDITGGPDDKGRVGLTVNVRTEPGFEGRGLGQGLTTLLRELIPLLLKVFEKEWQGQIVYVIRQDKAAPAGISQIVGSKVKRKGWTTSQAQALGFTDDSDYIKRFLGEDFLPLPEKTLVRVYKHPKL